MRRKPQIIIAGLLITVVSVLTITVSDIRAQNGADSITLSVSPPVFELSANPGEAINNKIRVTNLSDSPKEIFVEKRNFTALGEEGGVDLREEGEDSTYSLASWVSVNTQQATIPSNDSVVFDFTIAVPANAEPGGHFGSLIFRTEPTPVADGSGASVGQEIGSLLLVKVAGDITEEASIASFTASKDSYESGTPTLVTRVENTGNVHFKPRGKITINNMFGREVATLDLEERNVLPQSIRKVETEWADSGFRLGRYKANLSMVYGADDTILSASTSFYILPIKLILGVLAVLALVGFIGYRFRDRFREAYKALAGKR